MLTWVVRGEYMTSDHAKGRVGMPRSPRASPLLQTNPILLSLIVLSFAVIVRGELCPKPNCTAPEVGGGGTPSFDPSYECYDAGTAQVNITCDGYLFGQPSVGDCSDAVWNTDLKPTCEKSSCGTAVAPVDGFVDEPENTALFDEVEYSCNDDLFLEGPSMAWCQGTGDWIPAQTPTCSGYCVTPDVDKGNVTFFDEEDEDTPHEGVQIAITCDDAYTLTGPSNITCHAQDWSPDVGECLAKCVPPIIPNSNYEDTQDDIDHGEYILVTCSANFTSGSGSNITEPLTCNNSTWDADVTCYADCPDPTMPDNGSYNESYPFYHNDQVFYACDENYTLVGDSSRTCDDGTWTNTVPECKDHCELPVIDNSNLNGTGVFVSHDVVVDVLCDVGYDYAFNATHGSSFICNDGDTNHTDIVCKETCDSLTIDNSNLATPRGVQYWEPVVINCNDGYTSGDGDERNETIVCTGNSWDTTVYCYANCENISAPDGGNMYGDSYPFFHDELVNFNCTDDTYIFQGEPSLTCINGSWSDLSPECKESCKYPDVNNSVIFDPDPSTENYMLHGEPVDVLCLEGYTSGSGSIVNETIYCDDGSYNITVFCYADCGNVMAPTNGFYDASPPPYHHGNQASFSCNGSYTVDGNETVTCVNGNWTPAFPTCERDCTDPGEPVNGIQTGDTSYEHGSILGFECNDDGLDVLGAAEIECMAGEWTDPVPTCFNKTVVDLIRLSCDDEEFTVEIPWSLVEGHLDPEEITLKNSSCTGTGNESSGFVYITARLDECLTEREELSASVNGTIIYYDVYRNNVRNKSKDGNYSGPSVDIDVACSYNRKGAKSALGSVSYVLGNYTLSSRLRQSGIYTFDFEIYEDGDFTQIVSAMPHTVGLGEALHFGIGLAAGAGPLRVVAQDCWATPSSNEADTTRWDLISDECAASGEETLLFYEDDTRSLFSVDSVRFIGMEGMVYIHCDVLVCEQTSSCTSPWEDDCPAATTSRRRRRSLNNGDRRNMHRLKAGPVRVARSAGADNNQRSLLYREARSVPYSVKRDEPPFIYIVAITCLSIMCLILVACLAVISAKLSTISRSTTPTPTPKRKITS